MVKQIQLFISSGILFLFLSCSIESAKPVSNKTLVIASNFLNKKDLVLFKKFNKESNIKLELISMSADSIRASLNKEGFNSKIDLVFIHSIQHIKKLDPIVFQGLNKVFINKHLPNFQSFSKNWMLVGLDPYILSYIPDSLDKPTTYRELTSDFLWACPDESSLAVLKAQVHIQFLFLDKKKQKSIGYQTWLRKLKDHRVTYVETGSEKTSRQLLLLPYCAYMKNEKLIKDPKRRYIIPDDPLYDFYGMAVVQQARNYYEAKQFLLFWQERTKEQAFLNRFGMVPIHKNGKRNCKISPEKISEELSK